MRNFILNFPAKQKQPVFGTVTLASGTFSSVGAGEYTLTDNAGVSVTSGAVTGNSTTGLTLTEWVTVDGQALSLSPGVYVLDLLLAVTPSDSIARNEAISILLNVPGVQTARAHYPTGDDLQVFLTSCEMLENPPTASQKHLDLESAVAAAIAEFEKKTNRRPFLSTGTDTTKTFSNFFQGKVFFNADLLSLSTDADAFSINGMNYTLDTQFSLYPQNAPSEGKPYTYALFYASNFFFPETTINPYFLYDYNVPSVKLAILVKGVWGYALTVPHDAWTAILHRAAALLAPQLALSISGGLYEAKRLNYTLRYTGSSITPLSAEAKVWDAEFYRQVALYRRIRTTL